MTLSGDVHEKLDSANMPYILEVDSKVMDGLIEVEKPNSNLFLDNPPPYTPPLLFPQRF